VQPSTKFHLQATDDLVAVPGTVKPSRLYCNVCYTALQFAFRGCTVHLCIQNTICIYTSTVSTVFAHFTALKRPVFFNLPNLVICQISKRTRWTNKSRPVLQWGVDQTLRNKKWQDRYHAETLVLMWMYSACWLGSLAALCSSVLSKTIQCTTWLRHLLGSMAWERSLFIYFTISKNSIQHKCRIQRGRARQLKLL